MTSTTYQSPQKCEHCGCLHDFPCPRIKAIEYYETGAVKRVEYVDVSTGLMPFGPAIASIGAAISGRQESE